MIYNLLTDKLSNKTLKWDENQNRIEHMVLQSKMIIWEHILGKHKSQKLKFFFFTEWNIGKGLSMLLHNMCISYTIVTFAIVFNHQIWETITNAKEARNI